MESSEENGGNVVCNWGFELSCFPVHHVRSYGLELGELGIQDLEVLVMSEIDPANDEHAKVLWYQRMVDVVQGFGGLSRQLGALHNQEEITLTARKKSLIS